MENQNLELEAIQKKIEEAEIAVQTLKQQEEETRVKILKKNFYVELFERFIELDIEAFPIISLPAYLDKSVNLDTSIAAMSVNNRTYLFGGCVESKTKIQYYIIEVDGFEADGVLFNYNILEILKLFKTRYLNNEKN